MKTALFDIGNVLLAFDFTPALSSLLGSKAEPNALEKIMERKNDFESGKIDKAEYIPWASKLLDFSGEQKEFEAIWSSIFTPIQPMWKLARELKSAGYQLILFSNTNSIHAAFFLNEYAIFEIFDGAVFSHEIGAMKPNDAFYEKAIEKYKLSPHETIYFDDLEANIQAGIKFGFTSLIYDFNQHAAFLDTLEMHLYRPL
jgi:HAD superfamily hydrolase (TIGR01509 family)